MNKSSGELCDCCQIDLIKYYNNLIKYKAKKISKLTLLNYKLNNDVMLKICEYLINPYHLVYHECKSRLRTFPPIHEDRIIEKPEDFDYNPFLDESEPGYYWVEYKKVCTKCFQRAIFKSLIRNAKRLPYLRNHISYFMENDIDFKDNLLDKNFYNYIFPLKFNICYHRRSHPKKIGKLYHISTV